MLELTEIIEFFVDFHCLLAPFSTVSVEGAPDLQKLSNSKGFSHFFMLLANFQSEKASKVRQTVEKWAKTGKFDWTRQRRARSSKKREFENVDFLSVKGAPGSLKIWKTSVKRFRANVCVKKPPRRARRLRKLTEESKPFLFSKKKAPRAPQQVFFWTT